MILLSAIPAGCELQTVCSEGYPTGEGGYYGTPFPIASITYPIEGDSFILGEEINFSAFGQSQYDCFPPQELSYVVTQYHERQFKELVSGNLDEDGLVSLAFPTVDLGVGNSLLSFVVTDPYGVSSTLAEDEDLAELFGPEFEDEFEDYVREVIISVLPNSAPSISLLAPSEGAVYSSEVSLLISAAVMDDIAVADTTIGLELQSIGWTASGLSPNAAGELEYLGPILEEGKYTLLAAVTDPFGSVSYDQVSFDVGNSAPQCEITYPQASSTEVLQFPAGDWLLFEGLVGDVEDSYPEISVEWSSDVDGVFYISDFVSNDGRVYALTNTLSAGGHILYLTATDGDGAHCATGLPVQITE